MVDDDALERVPCPDDMCTGVLDERGICGTCGRSATGLDAGEGLRAQPLDAAVPTPDDAQSTEERARHLEHESDGDPTHERVPCPDEMCTGVLGEDGACGTCGRRATGG